ncbi:hypothetical protein LTR85_000523 [Meristemomyces frigidus]|nr:hypothetical protein LTR85_000523 [Meristemomyces frigidus]
MAVEEDVYCTLVMTDAYLPGAAVLAHSLRDAGTKQKFACLVTQDTLRASTIAELRTLYDHVIPIDRIGNPNPANLYLMNRPDLLYTFTKINLWRLTQFRKVVYIDSDVVALRAPDELFDTEEQFAAAPDVGWPDAFNTGVMVLTPHMGEYWALRTMASAGDSFDGADQGLLNQYFEHRPWKRLSFMYNSTPSANYQYEPAYRYYKRAISLVHFIGGGKPWQQGRTAQGAPGAYQELLSRWWAVYDRHFRVSTTEYTSLGSAVRQEVKGEADSRDQGYSAAGYSSQSTIAPATTTEAPFTEPTNQAEALHQGLVEPTPTVQQRKFSAPSMEWDATRAAPPPTSRPEASNFPTHQAYEFNTSSSLFKPPTSYPEPPKDMWYDVPKEKPKKEQRPPSIFPWEEREIPKPSRKFIDEEPPAPPPPEPEPEEPEFAGADELAVTWDVEPKTPAVKGSEEAPWGSFGSVNKNAWDEVSGIEDYVRRLTAYQKHRGNTQVIHPPNPNQASQDLAQQPAIQQHVLSPSNEPEPAELIEKVRQRRESLILTDFPSAVERPSLPVTPAPRRRPTFWGQERDGEVGLPAAEGVPDQADWNPDNQLEQLRRNSLLGPGDLKLPSLKKSIPNRSMPAHASIPEETPAAEPDFVPISGGATPHGLDDPQSPPGSAGMVAAYDAHVSDVKEAKAAPMFVEPGFAAAAAKNAVKAEDVLGPTETTA